MMNITQENKHEEEVLKFLNDRLIGSMLIFTDFDFSKEEEINVSYIIKEIKPRKRLKPKEELYQPKKKDKKRWRNTNNDEYKIHCYDITNNKKKILSWTINGINKLLNEHNNEKKKNINLI